MVPIHLSLERLRVLGTWRLKNGETAERDYYQLNIPRLWAEKVGFDRNPEVRVEFNGILKVIPKGGEMRGRK
jgi:hypothetical protein